MEKYEKLGLNICSLVIFGIGIMCIVYGNIILYVLLAIMGALLCYWANCISVSRPIKYEVFLILFLTIVVVIPIIISKIPKKVHIEDIFIKYDVDVLYKRENSGTYSFDVEVTPNDYTEKLLFTSSNENVLKIDESGKFKIIGIGEATLTVQNESGTVIKSTTITVKDYIPLESFELDTGDINMSIGDEHIINVIPYPKEATGDLFFFETEFLLNDMITIEKIDSKSAKIIAKGNGCIRLKVYDIQSFTNEDEKYKPKYIKVCIDPLKELKIEKEIISIFSGKICNRTDRDFYNVHVMYPLSKSKYDTSYKEFASAKKEYLKIGECWDFIAKNENQSDYSYYKNANILARDESEKLFIFPDPFGLNNWES